MFADTRIERLIAWGFAIVIVLSAVMALITFQQSRMIAADITRITGDRYPKVMAGANIRFNVMRNWGNSLILLQVTDAEAAKRITEEMEQNSKAISESFAYLEKTILSEEGKRLLGAALTARKNYTENRKRFLEMLKTGSRDEANLYLATTLRQNIDAYTAAIGGIMAYQTKQMDQAGESSGADIGILQTSTILLAILVAAISVATAFLVVRLISRALGGDVRYASGIAREIAAGNLSIEVKAESGDANSLLASMQIMRDRLREMVSRITSGAAQVSQAARQLAEASGAVAHASTQQSEATAATAAAVEQMTAGISQITQSAEEAKTISRHSQETSQQNVVVIRDAAAEMDKIAETVEASARIIGSLEEQSREIATVVGVIKEIADQTNLLALNAAIEAARAGEQGRGFAVVADEVRKLAERTSISTQEIAATIDKIQSGTQSAVHSMVAGVDQVKAGTSLAQQAGASIADIETEAKRVVSVVNDISNSLQEQSAASNDIARNVENIASMVEHNNASAEQAAAAATQLQRLAQDLSATIGHFRL